MKWKYHYTKKGMFFHFDEIFMTVCIESCPVKNLGYSQMQKCPQHDISVSA